MKLTVTPAAVAHFIEEWDFKSGDFIRLFIRYGGHSTVHPSFSMGIAKDQPQHSALTTVEQGITFYMEQDEVWYLEEKDLTIDFNEGEQEIVFAAN